MRRTLAVLASVVIWVAIGSTVPVHATAPGHNGRIAFRRYFNDAHTRGAIFIIDAGGTVERRLTHQPGSMVTTEPDWSADGHRIVYDIWPHGNDERSRIAVIRANGAHQHRLDRSCDVPCLTDAFPQWSPDARRIVFQRGSGPSLGHVRLSAVWVMRADGSHVRRVTQIGADPMVGHRFSDGAPTWSPTGRRVAFTRTRTSDGHTALFTVRTDGSRLRRLTAWKHDAGQPDWSPDGHWIAIYMDSQAHVGLIHPDGEGLHVIASDPFSYGSLSFSPDGTKITVSHRISEDANPDVYTMNVDGTGLQNVTNTAGYESAPDWGPRRT